MKKLVSILLTMFIAIQVFSCLAYDEDGVANYLEQLSGRYTAVEDIDNAQDEITDELINTYYCTADEAYEVFTGFRDEMKNVFERNAEENKSDDNTAEEDGNANETKMLSEIDMKKSLFTQLGIISDEEIDYSEIVSRGRFAVYVADLMSGGSDYADEKGYFRYNDLERDSEYYSAAAYLTNKGVMSGYGDGTFAPDDPISAEQVCTVLVKLLGYEKIKPENADNTYYYIKAYETGIMDDVALKNMAEPITFGQLITMMYNITEAKVVSGNDIVNGNVKYTLDKTFLEAYTKLKYTEDVVTANSETSLLSEKGKVSKGKLKVGDTVYDFENGEDYGSNLGKRVRVYYENTDEAKAVIELKKYNEYKTVLSSEINRYDLKQNRLYYTPKDTDKEKYESVEKDAAIIFNGIAVDYEHDKSLMFKPDCGEIVFIDNDSDGTADVIIIKSYVYYISGIINPNTPVLHDRTGIQPDIELDSDGITVMKGTEKISCTDIVSDQLLMAAPSRAVYKTVNKVPFMYADAENSTRISIEVCGDTKGGKISEYDESEDEIRIENEKYKISEILRKSSSAFPDNKNLIIAEVGTDVNIKTDKYGEIAYFKIISYGRGLEYGIIRRIAPNNKNDAYYARIFNQAGKHVSVKLAEKVEVYSLWNTNAAVSKSSYYSKKLSAEAVSELDGDSFNRRLVKYAVNDNGEIRTIYTAAHLPKDSFGKTLDFYIDKNVFVQGYSTVGDETTLAWYRIAAWFQNTSSTVHFYVPADTAADESEYSVAVGGSGNETFENTECYDISEYGVIGCEVHYRNTSSETGTWGRGKQMIVAKAPYLVWNGEKDESEYAVKVYTTRKNAKGISEAAFVEYKFDNSELVSLPAYYDMSRRIPCPEKTNIPISSIKTGDIIAATVDSATGKITAFAYLDGDGKYLKQNGESDFGVWKPIYSSKALCWTEWGDIQNPLNELYIKGRVVKNLDDTYLYIKTNQEMLRRAELKKAAYTTDIVCMYSLSEDKIKEISFGDIREGDYIIVYSGAYAMVVRD